MNKDKKSGWYYDDTIKVALVFLVLFVCYCIGVSVFISKGDDKLVGAFEAITGLSGLVLSFGTVFFVVKTYSAQKEQIRIQNIQIDIQKQEIEDNKKDLEFNRALDIVYKQLEHSKEKLVATKEEYKKYCEDISNYNKWFDIVPEIYNLVNLVNYENRFYTRLLAKSLLEQDNKDYLFQIYTSNFKYEFKQILIRSIVYMRKQANVIELYEEHILKTYTYVLELNMNAFGYHAENDEAKKREIVKMEYERQMYIDVSNFKIFIKNLKEIDETFHQYKVWM